MKRIRDFHPIKMVQHILYTLALVMLIGTDYDKIEFSLFNLDLLEPNVFVSDMLVSFVSFLFAFIVASRNRKFETPFFIYWKWLFIIHGITFFLGAVGHTFYNYLGVWGKFYPLVFGIGIPLLIEHAMLTLVASNSTWKLLSKLKALAALLGITIIMFAVDVEQNVAILILIPAMSTLVGLSLALGVLGYKFSRKIDAHFQLLVTCVVFLIPAAMAQALKINLHPWFDRNELTHVLIIITLILYFKTIEGYRIGLMETSKKVSSS